MKIFALETDLEKFKNQYCGEGDKLICTVRFHGFQFALTIIKAFFWALLLAAVIYGGALFGLPAWGLAVFGLLMFLIIIFPPLLKAFIDWRFDVLILTSEKLVVVDQSSIFRREVREMSLENIASANVETQFWNILPFGALCFDLKEGIGQRLRLKYIPHADEVAICISNTLTQYIHRKQV